MWEHQNRMLHNSPQAQQQILESRINNQIQAYYTRTGPQALPLDAMHFMAQSVEHQLALPLAAKQQWLESMELAIARKSNMISVIICPSNDLCKGGSQ